MDFNRIIDASDAFDAWRPFPRLFMITYLYILVETVLWALGQETLSATHTALVSTIVGAAPFWFNFYVNSGKEIVRNKS